MPKVQAPRPRIALVDLDALLRTRRSVRRFRQDDVSSETIEGILELANWAPSAGNFQSRDFVVVRDAAMRRALARAALDQEFLAEAPVVVVVAANFERVARYGRRGRDLYAIQDAAAATQNLLLAAHLRGLATCWVGAFDEEAVRHLLDLPPRARPVALVALGTPAEWPEAPDRLKTAEYVHWERW
jgi:nitroreductase